MGSTYAGATSDGLAYTKTFLSRYNLLFQWIFIQFPSEKIQEKTYSNSIIQFSFSSPFKSIDCEWKFLEFSKMFQRPKTTRCPLKEKSDLFCQFVWIRYDLFDKTPTTYQQALLIRVKCFVVIYGFGFHWREINHNVQIPGLIWSQMANISWKMLVVWRETDKFRRSKILIRFGYLFSRKFWQENKRIAIFSAFFNPGYLVTNGTISRQICTTIWREITKRPSPLVKNFNYKRQRWKLFYCKLFSTFSHLLRIENTAKNISLHTHSHLKTAVGDIWYNEIRSQ